MDTETWKMYHFNYVVWKSDENIHQKKMKWSAMVCFPMSHYIFTQSYELPYQNSGVYIKLDLEPLTYPVRQADLNYHWRLPLSCRHLSFPKQGARLHHGNLLGFIFNLLVLLPNLKAMNQIDVAFPSSLQAFLSAALVKEEASGQSTGGLAWAGAGLCCRVPGHGTEPGAQLSEDMQAVQLLCLGWQHKSCASLLLGPYRLLNIYLSPRLFSYPQESRLSGQLFSFGIGSQRGMWLTPFSLQKGPYCSLTWQH